MGSRTSLAAVCTTRSRIAGMPSGLSPPRASGSSPCAPELPCTSSPRGPSASPITTSPAPPPRSSRTLSRPPPVPRDSREPAGMHGKECPPEKSYRRAGRSGKPVRPSLYSRASSEGSGSLAVFQGSSPITSPSYLQKHVKSRGPSLHRHYPASTVSGRRRRPLKGSPPSAAQTERAVFPHSAFMNGFARSEEKESVTQG